MILHDDLHNIHNPPLHIPTTLISGPYTEDHISSLQMED